MLINELEGLAMSIQGGKYVQIEPGVELFVQDVGQGDPIVFIPGWTFTTEVFHKQVEYYQSTNRVIVIDPRSHGRSSVTLHGNNYVTHGSDLKKVIDLLELKSVTLVGWSFGLLTVWEYVRQFGTDNIKSVVGIDISPKPLSTNEEDWVEGPLDEVAALHNTYTLNPEKQREFVSAYVTDVMITGQIDDHDLEWLIEQSLKTPHYIAANLFAAGMFSNYIKEAKQVGQSIPLLTVVSEHWAETATSFLNKHVPEADIKVLGGHLMFWEHDEQFHSILDKFLDAQ